MLFSPYEMKRLCKKDGRQLQDGFSLVEVWQARRLSTGYRYRDDTGTNSTTRGDELVDDVVSVITSMAARISGRRQSKRHAEKIKQCVEQAMKEEESEG